MSISNGELTNNLKSGKIKKELETLLDKKYSPAIDQIAFPNTPTAVFWSLSPVAAVGNLAWGVGFDDGYDDWSVKNDVFQVRLVRSGQ